LNYKKIIPDQEIRFKILNFLRFIPDSLLIRIQYFIKLSRFPNLRNPKRFSEKIQIYKLKYRNPKITIATDKYRVREYVESKGLSGILNTLYFVGNVAEDIDYNALPEKFVIKTNNGSGTNILCNDKNKLNINEANKKINTWLSRNFYVAGRGWSYKNIEPKVIVEEYLEDKNQQNGVFDYKFLCFNGEPHYIVHDVNRYTDHVRNIYDNKWNFIDVYSVC